MKKLIYSIGMFFVLSAGCSSTQLVSSWKAPDGTLQRYNKILVIALMGAKDRDIRESVENAMVTNLKSHGINAGSAYAEYGPKAFEAADEQAALNRIRRNGYDGAFTIALLDKEKEKRYTPGSVSYVPYTYYNRFWGYYHTVYTRLYNPGYYSVTTNYMLEANFYNLSADKLEYSAQTKSFDPSSAQTLASEVSNTLIDDMIKKKIVRE
ncbi:hypothetical protein [Pedobacter sp. BS3]|uniref:hypothetical protein n=1 Tax=Pedobacter sp. BS3 TaxID=2567937 RepID=UPI0016591145|nr:hypothetical protein [Pedobacter sp. BS3]